MRYYTHETRGCKEGDNCAYLHINLCQSSIETKKCMDVNGTAMHLAGTKRPKSMLKKKKKKDTVTDPSERARDNKSANPKPPLTNRADKTRKKNQRDSPKELQDSFLGMKSLLDEMKTTVRGEISALKTEMGQFKQQLATLMTTSPHNLPMAPYMYGHCRPTQHGVPPFQQLPQQQRSEKFLSQPMGQPIPYSMGMTHIPPACC